MAVRDKAKSAAKTAEQKTVGAGHLMTWSFLEIFSLVGALLFGGIGTLAYLDVVDLTSYVPASVTDPIPTEPAVAVLAIGALAAVGTVLFVYSRGDEEIMTIN
jgi:hypothetical protein